MNAWLAHWYHSWAGALSGTVNVTVASPVALFPVTPSSQTPPPPPTSLVEM